MAKRLSLIVLVIAIFTSGLYLGLRNANFFGSSDSTSPKPGDIPKIKVIVAQGRIVPLGGIVNIPAPPGQRVESLLVAVGDSVIAGKTELAKLAGHELLELQVQMAAAKRVDAELEIDQKIVVAEINLRAAEAARDTARLTVEQLRSRKDYEIAAKQIESARQKLDRMRLLSKDPQTENLVSQQDLDDQAILLEKAEYDKQRGEISLQQAQESADLSLKNSELNIESAKRSVELANQLRSGNKSLLLAESIAQVQEASSRLIAPADGIVLKIFIKPGEAAANGPIMQIGNLARMECVAEVNDRIVRQVRVGQKATIKNSALSRELVGTVRQIGRIVGNSTLPNPNPLAMVDTKSVDVHIEIDSADVAEAATLVHLQTNVEIDPGTTPTLQDGSVARTDDNR